MTVYSDVSKARYVGNGVTKEFVVPFPYMTNNDGTAQLSVYLGDSDTPLTEGKEYYVDGVGNYNEEVGRNEGLISYEQRYESGTIIFETIPEKDTLVAIVRNVALIQGVSFIDGEKFPAQDYANGLDKLTMAVQEIKETMERAVILPPTSKEKPIEVRTNILKAADEAKKTAEIAIELVGEAPETIRQETENAKNIITEFTDEKTEEFEQTAITATEQAVGSAERSRIWAEGEQEEVETLGGELSSKGWVNLAQEEANNAKTSADRAEKIAQEFDGIVNTIEGSIGDIGFAPLGIDETQNKRRYLNGQVINQAQFASFTAKLKRAIELHPNLATTEENWQAEIITSVLDQCGKFVIDDELGTIRLPKVVNINGLQDLALMGSIKAESLPNITGGMDLGFDVVATRTSNLGAFKYTATTHSYGGTGGGSTGCYLDFDASRNSSTYQDNAPVQQEAVQYPYFIQVATGTEESVDVTREIELNNPFSLLDYKWSEYEISNASWLLSNGAFHSGATYVAVYELLLKIHNGTFTKDGVSVKLSTEEYTDTDFVINTADTTFRLPIKVKLASGNAVVGNGMTLGLTDGTNNYGLQAGEDGQNRYIFSKGMYGQLVGSGRNTGDVPTTEAHYGVTTDPTKSGIETSSNGLKLYFYAGETVQDANVINASGVLTRVAELSDSYISGLGMPSDRYIDLTLGATGTRYTAPANGWFMFGKTATGAGQRLGLFNKGLNGATKNGIALYNHASSDVLFAYMPVIKGEVVETVYTMAGTTNYFRFIYAEGEN